MAYITEAELKNFTNKFVEEDTPLVEMYLDSAMDTIKNYLGYDPELKEYETTSRRDGSNIISLNAPVVNVLQVFENGVEMKDEKIDTAKNYVFRYSDNSKKPFKKDIPYTFVFQGGFETVPSIIKITALQIASLLWESQGGNLAVNSTSFADSGTRVFNNFKIDRFLEQISKYRIFNQ